MNPGSVGQPRDKDPRASYALLDTVGDRPFRRVRYDFEITQSPMRKAGLPERLSPDWPTGGRAVHRFELPVGQGRATNGRRF